MQLHLLARGLVLSMVLGSTSVACGDDGSTDSGPATSNGGSTNGTVGGSESGATATTVEATTVVPTRDATTQSTTGDATGDTTAAGTGSGTCPPDETDNACLACVKAECCDARLACAEDVDCDCFATCVIDQGGEDVGCAMRCGIDMPGDNDAIVGVIQCRDGTCVDRCGG